MRRRRQLHGLLAGSTISWLGTAMTAVALPGLVLVETGSASRTGIVGFVQMAPYVLLHAAAGPLVDRFGADRLDRRGDRADRRRSELRSRRRAGRVVRARHRRLRSG